MYMHKKIFVIRQKKEVYRKSWFQNRITNRTIGEDGLVLLIRKQNFDWDELFFVPVPPCTFICKWQKKRISDFVNMYL